MSLTQVQELFAEIPYSLKMQVESYAESVDRAMPEIFRELGRPFDGQLSDQVVFWSGVRKFYSSAFSELSTIESCATLLDGLETAPAGPTRVRIGGEDYSRSSATYFNIRRLIDALNIALNRTGEREYIFETPRETLERLSS